jgi:nucleoside-diphosphate-sugar epimerase
MLCATQGAVGEVYNLASGVETTIRELADEINRNVDPPAELQLAERRTWDHSGNRVGSTDKASSSLGFVAEVGLADGIRRTVDWTRSNLAVIDAAIERHRAHVSVP